MTDNSRSATQMLPAWQIILRMVRFRPWFWLVDLVSVFVVRISWQILPGLIMRRFFNLITGDAQVLECRLYSVHRLVLAVYGHGKWELAVMLRLIGIHIGSPP